MYLLLAPASCRLILPRSLFSFCCCFCCSCLLSPLTFSPRSFFFFFSLLLSASSLLAWFLRELVSPFPFPRLRDVSSVCFIRGSFRRALMMRCFFRHAWFVSSSCGLSVSSRRRRLRLLFLGAMCWFSSIPLTAAILQYRSYSCCVCISVCVFSTVCSSCCCLLRGLPLAWGATCFDAPRASFAVYCFRIARIAMFLFQNCNVAPL